MSHSLLPSEGSDLTVPWTLHREIQMLEKNQQLSAP